jgi:predicted dithiol-disulfide oxidoreductase (DUF899 family)
VIIVVSNIVSREEWQAARDELLVLEKAHTRERERIAQLRRDLPRVLLEKDYLLISEEGAIPLQAVFRDHAQLAVYHLMFGEEWDTPCIGCTQWADALNNTTHYFKGAGASLVAVSSASIEKIMAEKEKRGWTFTWLSSSNSDFNVDFHGASNDSNESSRSVGSEEVFFDRGENHGVSIFSKNDDEQVLHTYSSYNRGIEELNGAFGYYDLLPNGRKW